MDQSLLNDHEEKKCAHVAVHNGKKDAQETRATKLTCNQTLCPYFQHQHGHVDGTTLCDEILRAFKEKSVETIFLLQEMFGNEVFGVSTIKKWHKMFPDSRELVEFKLWSGNWKLCAR